MHVERYSMEIGKLSSHRRIRLVCPNCRVPFAMTPAAFRNRKNLADSKICCSRPCSLEWRAKVREVDGNV